MDGPADVVYGGLELISVRMRRQMIESERGTGCSKRLKEDNSCGRRMLLLTNRWLGVKGHVAPPDNCLIMNQ